jgi:glycolate oxidase iron-sulfur subunit
MLDLALGWRSRSQAPRTLAPQAGATRGRVGMLTGCVQRAMFGDVNAATARALVAAGYEVVAPAQRCCGALSAHAGRSEEADRFTAGVRDAFAGIDTIVVNSSGCGSHLKERDLPALDVTEALEGVELPDFRPLPLRVAYQDSCHMRHAQRLPGAWRPLLERIPGLELVEPAEQEICCGSAGIYNITQPEAARALGARKAAHVRAMRADVLASANPGCLVQVARAMRDDGQGSPPAALHPVELLDASLRGVDAATLLREARR